MSKEKLPDEKICKTKPVETAFSWCLVKEPKCEYAVPFGYGYLCTHPKCKDFQGKDEEKSD